ncbi:FtsX-like permease family protein [Gordonibacter urolithinfaciens]|uniref:FtsX-like permease family protein n=1 Tax=Gordonibacter urolithinfaciens TaxID=1335613 RepID=UPI000F4B21A5|nr:ABC transporter permease [Gordonibacter urolithinfaciens]ROT89634.1 ABC transporter permease [Gordonibacter urolithinfaciens]GKG90626.1 ABC transporter permease [Gordonibacter pamelaeae]
MLAKLAFRNIRRSVKDYGVYFVTLVFGVAVFYAFNSVSSQSILFDLEDTASASVFSLTGQFLGMFSVLIACVLGFLVLYANGFLIRRRKQEFGTYLMLGMNPRSVSAIVLMETAVVGLVSLVVGLALGFALSQGMSFVTAGLFNIEMTQYRFIFSFDAFLLTLVCFALIFAVTALFNTVSIRRYKLIDLLSARSKNARFRVRNPWISLAGFVAAVGLIAWAYATLVENGLLEFDDGFWKATALMVVGTFLLFWSLAGFAIAVIERTRGVYFKGLMMFTMRQIASKVNTAFVSLSVVCVMLFFSLTVFSTGMGLARAFSGNIEDGTVYDATLTANVYLNQGGTRDPEALAQMTEEDREYQKVADEKAAAIEADAEAYGWDIAAKLADASSAWDELVAKSAQIDAFVSDETSYGELMGRYGQDTGNAKQNEALHNQGVTLIGVSQFNALAELAGRPTVDVGEDGYAVNNTLDAMKALSEALARKGETVVAGGRVLESSGELRSQPMEDTTFSASGAELIVPDAVIAGLRAQGAVPEQSILNLMYRTDRAEGDKLLEQVLAEASPANPEVAASGWKFSPKPWPVTLSFTAEEVLVQSGGMNLMISYLALYIGFVFLIATAAVLAIQQLSEASDSLPRYRVLAEIGCDRRMIVRSLRAQVLVYFLVPLAVAVCHTVCAVGVISDSVISQLGVSVLEPALMTAVLVAVVYGAYLAVTYFASKGIIRASLGKKLVG